MLITNVDSDRPPLCPGHPVRDGPHSQLSPAPARRVTQRWISVFQRPHPLIIPHVLVDLEHHPGSLAVLDHTPGLARTTSPAAFFRQDAPHPTTMVEHPRDRSRLVRSGGTAMSTTWTAGSSSIGSTVGRPGPHPAILRSPEPRSFDRDVIPATRIARLPRYAGKWQSPAPMNPAPINADAQVSLVISH